jgi:alginate O-acetyltransferase complex protein AlgI
MQFDSIRFLIFFILVFSAYWLIKKHKYQNLLLIGCSYFFYGLWDWRFLFLLIFSTILDFFSGYKIHAENDEKVRKRWLWLSVGVNLIFLGFFKYYNFFVDNFAIFLQNIGFSVHLSTLNIVLPVGISFYTLHGLSYVFDIYNRKIIPTSNFINYGLFVSFFPILVAGPIERATHLLPQIEQERTFDYAKAADGMRQILWGLFKKMVIADNCAVYVDEIFKNYTIYSGSDLLLGGVLFAFQIYGDFSGYSDMALGTARLLGIELLRNFDYPYFSKNIAEFWRKWHISLSSWLRDYLYIPLGGNNNRYKNIVIVFGLSGLWHGANWTFIAWGLLNAAYLIGHHFLTKFDVFNKIKVPIMGIFFTFMLTVVAWIFFRSSSIDDAVQYIQLMFSGFWFSRPQIFPRLVLLLIVCFVIVEWFGRHEPFAIAYIGKIKLKPIRWFLYFLLLFSIAMFMSGTSSPFIYFQF